jgi:hypothetical protein
MRKLAFVALLLTGCASPDYVATRGDYDVCRLSMGGPHAQLADAEARRRGLDCRPLYPVIQNRMAAESAAVQHLQQPTLTCQTIPWGMGTRTVCD